MSWWTELFPSTCQGERPGGLALTQRAVTLCGFTRNHRLLDVASGQGATVNYLRDRLECQVIGIDQDPARQCANILLGHAEQLPFFDASMDGVFLECSLSQMPQGDLVLEECARVLRSGGRLVVSDLYARNGVDCPSGPLGRLDSQRTLEQRLKAQGLAPTVFEDHSKELIQLWASAVMSGTGTGVSSSLLHHPALQEVKCGYCLCVAEKQSVPQSCQNSSP